MMIAHPALHRPAPARHQRGAGLIGTLLLLICIGFAAVVTIKGVPTYLEFRSVKSAVAEASAQATPALARDRFSRQAQLDNITSVSASDLIITSEGSRFTIRAAWDKLVPLFGPVYLMIKYDTRQQ